MTTPSPAADPRGVASALGLTAEEYDRVVAILGRAPSTAELGSYSVMWSEHCSYKSSKVHLRRLPTHGERILVGPGENAGVVDVGGGLAVTFKIESHNHPSFVEPFQGAATGVGGIVRDILTMGARPIALLDALRFGDPRDATTRWVVDGVVRGIGHYGNSIGVPTVGGELAFDPCYQGNPLVNVLCVGVLERERIQLARAERSGDVAVLIGQRTGRDGIGGASVLASATFAAEGVEEAKRPNVQVGDPFAAKRLIECCLELYDRELLSGIQDLGAAGIACSTSELASAAGLGMHVDLDAVPLREQGMEAWEILCSESQERMLALVHPDRLTEVLSVCARWETEATPIGTITADDRLVIDHHGERVHDAPATSLADEGPVYERPLGRWTHPDADVDVDGDAPTGAEALRRDAWAVLTAPNVVPARWIWQQYDHLVGHATVLGPPADAAVLRLRDDDVRGVAVATDGNGRWCALDPLEGARRVVAEAARNVACVGATPLAATNCLNFGSPEDPAVMDAFARVIDGLADACRTLGTPITGGNVSFYNATGEVAVHPTPIVGVVGVLEDVRVRVPTCFSTPGDAVLLLGAATRPGLAGSEWDWVVNGRIAGRLEPIDLMAEARLQALLSDAAAAGLLASAHDVADGGLLVTLAEAAGGLGCAVDVLGDEAQHWFSESPTRVVVSCADPRAVAEMAADHVVEVHRLGEVTADGRLVGGALELDLLEVAARQERVLPGLFE